MLDRLRSFLKRRYAPALVWSAIVTLAMAWPIAFPYVPPQGVTVREDTTNFTMFEMSGDNYAAILGAVESGRLVMSDMQGGFKLFTRGSLRKAQLAGRIRVGGRVIDQYVAASVAVGKNKRLGTVLVEQGALDPREMVKVVIDQTQEIIYSLFLWTEGLFHMTADPDSAVEPITLKLVTPHVIIKGISRIEAWSRDLLRSATPPVMIKFKIEQD